MNKIFTPIKIGNVELKNRMVSAPSVTYNAAPTGEVTQKQIDMYTERAKGGFGMVTVEATTIRPDGAAFPCFLALHHPRFLPGLSCLVEGIHLHGARAAIQLIHTGRNAQKEFIDTDPIAPSDRMIWRDKPRVLSTAECEEIVGLYAKSAGLAKSIGFDAINIHGALGHLPAQFLSPLTNDRTDKYGERTRFVVELIQAVRQAVGPNVAIVYRGAGGEGLPGGLTVEDWKKLLPVLEDAGVDAFDVYPGIFESVVLATLPLYLPEGSYLEYARALKEVARVPIMCVGKLMNPRLAIKAVEDGSTDIVCYTRPMFADPHLPRKMIQGQLDDIRRCCGCDRCVGDGFTGKMTECSINASFQREGTWRITPAPEKKKVLVAGGGVGGMEAARVAATRGHRVVLYEREQKLGGLIDAVSTMPKLYMHELSYVADDLSKQLRKLGVEVKLGQAVTPEIVRQESPDVVFVATGSTSFRPAIPGADKPHVLQSVDDYLKKKAPVGDRVVVVGGMHGAEVAISLRRDNRDVTIIDEYPNNVATAPYIVNTVVRWIALGIFMQQDGVKAMTGVKVKEITDSGVVIVNADGQESTVEAETVILALPRVSDRSLSTALKSELGASPEVRDNAAWGSYAGNTLLVNGKACALYEIGDCVEPRSMKEAIHAGAQYARDL